MLGDYKRLQNLKTIPKMLKIEDKYPAGHPKQKFDGFVRKLPKNNSKTTYKKAYFYLM